MNRAELKEYLDEKVDQYNNRDFIESDPIQIPHRFSNKEDIEIMGFLMATIAWGNRKSIITNGNRLIEYFGNEPYNFILESSNRELESLKPFVHRTFNGDDLIQFVRSLRNIYLKHGGLESIFATHFQSTENLQEAISRFKQTFFEIDHLPRTMKHVSDPIKGSAAKRINMYLRWMVRNDNRGVDFGIWSKIPSSGLSIPLDVHTGNISRKLGILKRKQNDSKAVAELDSVLRKFDPSDPVKYDYALFGIGVFEKL